VYYAVVKAYNSLGHQSDSSDELMWTAPDDTPPTITVPGEVTLVGNENDEAAIPDLTGEAVVADNCSDPANISVVQSPAAGTMVGLGTTTVTLTATDEAGNSADAVVNLIVGAMNRPPQVAAGSDQSIRLPANTVNLDGSVSDDGLPSESTVTVQWTKVSGPASVVFGDADAAATTVTFTQAGTYVLRLTATDGELTTTDEVTITVSPEPVPMPPSNLRIL